MGKSSRAREQQAANTAAAELQANAAMQVAQMQSSAALKAARIANQGALGAAGMMAGATMGAAHLGFRAAEMSLAEQKRQYDASVKRLQPYADLGEKFLPVIDDAATTEGYAQRLSDIMDTDIFSDLQDERMRAGSSQLSQAGLSRSGAAARAASNMTADLALSLDDKIYGRQMNNVAIGQAAAAGQNVTSANYANAVTGIHTGTAQSVGQIMTSGAAQQGQFLLQGANAQSAGLNQAAYYSGQGIMGAANARAGGMIGGANAYAQGRQNAQNAYIGAATAIAGMFFSDERLKENMQPIGKIKGLTLYEWDWQEFAKNVMGTEMTTGFKASEVKELYPHCVTDLHGVDAVDYDMLYEELNELERLAA